MKYAITLVFLSVVYSQFSFAGAFNLTHASRANCGNNESISWDLRTPHDLAASSVHYHVQGNFNGWSNRPRHTVATGAMYNVHRAAAVHWGESAPYSNQWYVQGHHWNRINRNLVVYRPSAAKDCNLSAGWL